MPYGYTIERIGYDRGEVIGQKKGEVKGQVKLILRQLDRKLGSIPVEVKDKISTLALSQIEDLGMALLDLGSIEDLKTWLTNSKAD
jgi:hypothetical protein